MEQDIQSLTENNPIIKQFFSYPKEELEVIRMFLNLELINIKNETEKTTKVKMVKTCTNETYNYLDYILSYRNKVDISTVSIEENIEKVKGQNLCDYCDGKKCVKKSAIILMDEIDKYNDKFLNKLSYISVIDYILERKNPEFKMVPNENVFSSMNLIDLLYVQIILENDLINLTEYNEESNWAKFEYLDLTKNTSNDYYINILLKYYKDKKNVEKLTINIRERDKILKEDNQFIRIYKIAAYYKFLIEIKKVDIIKELRKILDPENVERGMKVCDQYFIYKTYKKVDHLPYTKKTKEKIYNILNYILNYRYKEGTPFIPINILIYSNDKEGVETICEIVGDFMWFFGYLSKDMNYYSEYINNVILDKFLVKNLYDDKDKPKDGILLLHNFENLLYTDYMRQNLILNILTDEMEKNNKSVCTIIYGEREPLKQIISNHYKLSQMLINLELEIDNLDIDKIHELLIEKLEVNTKVSTNVEEKIYNYIKATYMQSDIKNMEYVNELYNRIILNMNNTFEIQEKIKLKVEHVPEAYNTRDLPTIMKDMNALVGLTQIKEQISDLISLLKFNKRANLDINNFNLHMIFSGNSGTGKTTVARLLKDIFYNLGYIHQNKLTEVTAKDLIAENLGQTSGKTFNVVKAALGGVLFIDEAYAITDGNSDDAQYGNECIATLLKLMEDYKDKLIIIFAGYSEKMENFQSSNPGLASRLGYKIQFPDYTLEELTQIYLDLLEKNELTITDEALAKLQEVIKESSKNKNFGNARYINTIFQEVLIEHSKNVNYESKDNNLYQIQEEDIKKEKLVVKNRRKKIGFE